MSADGPDPGPRPARLALLLLLPLALLIVVVLLLVFSPRPPRRPPVAQPPQARALPRAAPAPAPAEGYLYCTWNVENLFDDQDDPKNHDTDEDWFAAHPELVRQKLDHLADALLALDGGRGPDILAVVEVENRHAVEMLRDTLNARLPTELRYDGLVHHDNLTGRRIEPALLTRLQVLDDPIGPPLAGRVPRTVVRKGADDPHDFGIRRVLEARLAADGVPLSVLVSHWTSRVTDETDVKRSAYADVLYAATLDLIRRDPAADVILSGDYNDEPTDVALVDHLHVTADPAAVRASDPQPRLLDLMAGRDPLSFGTYYYGRRWQILDHLVASPGLLDPDGWQVLPATLRVLDDPPLATGDARRPFRFGGPHDHAPRGYSDHFAVTVRLRLNPPALH